jgi:hypothetical protein
MPVERRVHLTDAAAVRLGKGDNTPVEELVVIHGGSLHLPYAAANLPLIPLLANLDPTLKVTRHGLQMAEQRGFLVEDPGDESIVESAAPAAPDARRQGREGFGLAVAQAAP